MVFRFPQITGNTPIPTIETLNLKVTQLYLQYGDIIKTIYKLGHI